MATLLLWLAVTIWVQPDGTLVIALVPALTVTAARRTSFVATEAGLLSTSVLAPPAALAADVDEPKIGLAVSVVVPQIVAVTEGLPAPVGGGLAPLASGEGV